MAPDRLFDIELVRPCPNDPGKHAREILGARGSRNFWSESGFLGADLTLSDAKRLAKTMTQAGGAGLVVPSAYREVLVAPNSARKIAERQLEEVKNERGDIFGPLEEGREQSMWWRFLAQNLPAQAEGREPGCLYIDVDKVDGHIKTQADADEYAEWQKPDQVE